MKPGRYFTLISGILLTVLGIASFVPSLVSSPDALPDSILQFGIASKVGNLFGLFPINTVEGVVYLVFGVFGLAATIALDSARFYSGLTAIGFGLLTVLGLIPFANTVFGLFPVYGNDVWLHGAIAVLAAYFGFFAQPDLEAVLEREVGEGT